MQIQLRNDKGHLVATGATMEECAKSLIEEIRMMNLIIDRMRKQKDYDIEAIPGETIKEAIARALRIAENTPNDPIKLLHNDTILTIWADASPLALYTAWLVQQMPVRGE